MTEQEAVILLESRIALFEREIASVPTGARVAEFMAAVSRAVRTDIALPDKDA